MGKYDKLIEKMLNNPKDVSFEDLKKLLERNGYSSNNSGGSHYIFRKEKCDSITIPRKKPIKAIYVKRVIKILGL